jgi:ABC-2 type transport system ATP-binding protein
MLALIRDIAHGRGIDVILSTHILHDVEVVCDHVVVMHRGALVAQDSLAAMTASNSPSFEIRVKGDRVAFLGALRAEGLDAVAGAEDDEVRVPNAAGSAPILRAALASGVQVRRLRRPQTTLEDRFAVLVGS